MGRPSTYSEAKADAICEWISDGKALLAYCRQPNTPKPQTVYAWMERNPDFADRFARARERGYDAIAQEALEIADTPREGVETTEEGEGRDATKRTVTKDMLGHRKLQVWTRLQLLARWDPKRYGEKVGLDHQGGLSIKVVTGVPRKDD